jgi:hypothetical protein
MIAASRPRMIDTLTMLVSTIRQLNHHEQDHVLPRIQKVTQAKQDYCECSASAGRSFSSSRTVAGKQFPEPFPFFVCPDG